MKEISKENLSKINASESAWVCAGYTVVTVVTATFGGGAGAFLLAGFTAACWASVD